LKTFKPAFFAKHKIVDDISLF